MPQQWWDTLQWLRLAHTTVFPVAQLRHSTHCRRGVTACLKPKAHSVYRECAVPSKAELCLQGDTIKVGMKQHTSQPLCDWRRRGRKAWAAAQGVGRLLHWGLGHMGLPSYCSSPVWAT